MTDLATFKAQNPAYKDTPDDVLADALYAKFYSSMPRAEFDARIGYRPPAPPPAPAQTFADPMGGGIGGNAVAEVQPNTMPYSQQMENVGGWTRDFARRAGNALSFNMDDRAVAGIRSVFKGTPYADEIAAERAKSDAAAQRASAP